MLSQSKTTASLHSSSQLTVTETSVQGPNHRRAPFLVTHCGGIIFQELNSPVLVTSNSHASPRYLGLRLSPGTVTLNYSSSLGPAPSGWPRVSQGHRVPTSRMTMEVFKAQFSPCSRNKAQWRWALGRYVHRSYHTASNFCYLPTTVL